MRLISTPGLPAVDPRQAGLFHAAFLVGDQAALAGTVLRAAQDTRSRFVGSSDHLVSEAFCFADPEGNGIVLYRDRSRDQWEWSNGQVAMGTQFLDPNKDLSEHLTEDVTASPGVRPGIVGHVHLQVGDVDTARRFCIDTLGFETTVGTHPGAGPRATSLGLADVVLTVSAREDLDALVIRLKAAGTQFADEDRSQPFTDPWGALVTWRVRSVAGAVHGAGRGAFEGTAEQRVE